MESILGDSSLLTEVKRNLVPVGQTVVDKVKGELVLLYGGS
jgi:hypothetical protein